MGRTWGIFCTRLFTTTTFPMASSLVSKAPQCMSCVRRMTSSFGDVFHFPAGQQVRGKKKLASAKISTVKVHLLQNIPGSRNPSDFRSNAEYLVSKEDGRILDYGEAAGAWGEEGFGCGARFYIPNKCSEEA